MSSCSNTMTQNTMPTQQRTSSGEKSGRFRLAKSITRPYPNWAAFHLLNRRLMRQDPPKETTTERSYDTSLWRHHKRWMQFIDVNGLLAWCSYCNQRICNQILLFTLVYFKTICSYTFAHLKTGWWGAMVPCYMLIKMYVKIYVNIRKSNWKFWSI